MHYTALPERAAVRRTVAEFLGYNHRDKIGLGELYDMQNLTGLHYPLLCPRPQRGFYTGGSQIRSLMAKEQLCYADGTDIVIGTTHYDLGLKPGNTILVSMGAYIIALPDRKYINTVSPEDRGSMEAQFTAAAVTVAPCLPDGTPITPGAGDNPREGDYRLQGGSLQQFAGDTWHTVAGYVKLTAMGIGIPFRQGDGLHLQGLPGLGDTAVIQELQEDYLVIPGVSPGVWVAEHVTLSRRVPELDFCVEAGNRLWGCRYGTDRDGRIVNELYASKLGDFRNWECYQGLSTDSYRVSVGSDGPFTGAVSYLGDPLFFKEERLHRVYGTCPANFQVISDKSLGVQQGSGGSLAIVGETLFYKSRLGICAYAGGRSVDVSAALGDTPYCAAVAGAHRGRYYISMADGEGQYHLFVYDTDRGFWHREDNTQALGFASWGSDLYFIDAADGCIKTVFGSGAAYTSPIRWMAQSGLLGVDDPDHKYIRCLQLRLQLDTGSQVDVYLQYDSAPGWDYAGTVRGSSRRSFTLPIRPRRCDHLRLKLEGRGDAKVYSVTAAIEQGS